MLSTKTKIALAKVLYLVVKGGLQLVGKDPQNVVTTRNGITWHLDLEEGIDFYIFLFGKYEVSSLKLLQKTIKKGSTVLDIGANVGGHALQMANIVGDNGKILAIEPTNWAFQKLQRNLALNERFHQVVMPVQHILSDSADDRPENLYSSWSFDSSKVNHEVLRGGLQSTSEATTVTLDSLVEIVGIDNIDYIKIDVDGYECKVLNGAKGVLHKFKPDMLVEFCPYLLDERGGSLGEYLSILNEVGYKLYDIGSMKQLPSTVSELAKLIPKGGGINAYATVD